MTDGDDERPQPDDLPPSYIEADPNEGYDPYANEASAGEEGDFDSGASFGSVLFAEHNVEATLSRLRFEEGQHYIKTRDLARALNIDAGSCKHMMRRIEAEGWISEWGESTGITWYIELDEPVHTTDDDSP